jgi:rifampicin phosphotransferase
MRTTASVPESLALPFGVLARDALEIVGGKAANLGELLRAGLPVPDGFCVTTAAYGVVADGSASLGAAVRQLAETPANDATRLAELAAQARQALLTAPVPDTVVEAITCAYRELGCAGVRVDAHNQPDARVAVRSSPRLRTCRSPASLASRRRT